MPIDPEFYVGYLPMADGLKTMTRRVVIALGVTAVSVATLLIAGQHPFASSTFEFQQYGEFHGTLLAQPAPPLC